MEDVRILRPKVPLAIIREQEGLGSPVVLLAAQICAMVELHGPPPRLFLVLRHTQSSLPDLRPYPGVGQLQCCEDPKSQTVAVACGPRGAHTPSRRVQHLLDHLPDLRRFEGL